MSDASRARGLYSSLISHHSSLDRHTRQQILQIVVAPADAGADRERFVVRVQRVVDARAHEDRRRARRLFAQSVFSEAAHVRMIIALRCEVVRLTGESKAIVELIVDAAAAAVVEQSEADAEVAERPSRLR